MLGIILLGSLPLAFLVCYAVLMIKALFRGKRKTSAPVPAPVVEREPWADHAPTCRCYPFHS